MKARDLINYMIPPLKVTDDVGRARKWMDEIKLSELPVTDKGKFEGLITEDRLMELADNQVLSSLILDHRDACVDEDQHYYEVLKQAYTLGVRTVAVLSKEETYMGSISTEDVVEAFAQSSSVNNPGAIIVLSMEYRDYSLAEISRIVENDDSKILSSQLSGDTQDTGKVLVTLKLNKNDISQLRVIFESQGYRMVESFSESPESDSSQDRYDSFMNYLNI